MLRSLKGLEGLSIRASDGELGRVDEFYFDDEKWTVRYMVVETGRWLGRRVLLTPISFERVDWEDSAVEVSLTREQVRNSPEAHLDAPVSRQYERGYLAYYGYTPYWGGPGYWGPAAYPGALVDVSEPQALAREAAEQAAEAEESHLRSSKEVIGYHIRASDGEIGHVDDFLVDDGSWAIKYARIDTSNWIGGKAVLVPQSALSEVSWPERILRVSLRREHIEKSPEFDPSRITREYEERVTAYYSGLRA